MIVQATPVAWTSDGPHWQADVVLLSSPSPCMVSGRTCERLALRLTNVLDPVGRSVILDLAMLAALVDSGLDIVQAGLTAVEEHDPEGDT